MLWLIVTSWKLQHETPSGVDIDADLPQVCRILGDNHLKKAPVLDHGRVVGVINRSDITQYAMKSYLEREGL